MNIVYLRDSVGIEWTFLSVIVLLIFTLLQILLILWVAIIGLITYYYLSRFTQAQYALHAYKDNLV